jgi:hypothetical protein
MPLHILWGEGLLSYQPAVQLINQIHMDTMLYIELPEKQQAHSLRIFRGYDPVLTVGQLDRLRGVSSLSRRQLVVEVLSRWHLVSSSESSYRRDVELSSYPQGALGRQEPRGTTLSTVVMSTLRPHPLSRHNQHLEYALVAQPAEHPVLTKVEESVRLRSANNLLYWMILAGLPGHRRYKE